MSLVQQIKSPAVRMWLQSARSLWSLNKREAAVRSAIKVYQAEGREVFGRDDAELLAAVLASLASLPRTKKEPQPR